MSKVQMVRVVSLEALVIGLVAALTFGLTSRGPGSFIARGSDLVCIDAPDIIAGSQVTVTDSSGKVVSTSALVEDTSKAALAEIKTYDTLQAPLTAEGFSDSPGMSVYRFAVSVPAGQDRYGIAIGGPNRGTLWETEAEMRNGPQVTLGC